MGGISWELPGGFGEGEIYRLLEFLREEVGDGARLIGLQVVKFS